MYRQMFVALKRGNSKGVYSNAKPILLITLIDYVPNLKSNKLTWGNKEFEDIYVNNYIQLDNKVKITPLSLPFYFLSSEPFYEIVWHALPPIKSLKCPSSKTLRTYVNYARLDEQLWELLKNEEHRMFLRDSIVNKYFKDNGNKI